MHKKDFKGRCQKRSLSKCKTVCRTFDTISYVYADILQQSEEIQEFQCNVPISIYSENDYTTDFLGIKSGGDYMVRECVFRKHISKPMTVKLLDASKDYWFRRGVTDWGLVIDAEE